MHVVSKFPMSTRGSTRGRSLFPGLLLVGLSLGLPLGCQRSGPTEFVVEKPPEVTSAGRAAAAVFYKEQCVKCHGAAGAGDGPMALTVHPQPRRLTDRVWQANVTNARLRMVIVRGGAGVNKSAVMPAYPDLAGLPEVLDGMVALIRGFAAP